MHKVRLSKNNYQLVADNAWKTKVLMEHYNESPEDKKRELMFMVESYLNTDNKMGPTPTEEKQRKENMMQLLNNHPSLLDQFFQPLQLTATKVGKFNKISDYKKISKGYNKYGISMKEVSKNKI